MADVTITHDEERNRFEAQLDGEVVGYLAYEVSDGVIAFTHTVSHREGQGIGSALVKAGLDDVKERGGLRVVPQCPFVGSYIERNPQYADLLEAPGA